MLELHGFCPFHLFISRPCTVLNLSSRVGQYGETKQFRLFFFFSFFVDLVLGFFAVVGALRMYEGVMQEARGVESSLGFPLASDAGRH